MPRTLLGAGVLTILVFTAPAAFAQSDTNSRYTMAPTENGFVRLDTVTGDMSLCSKGAHGWFCRAMGSSNSSDASEKRDIDNLKAENAELRSELLRLERRLSELAKQGSSDSSQQAVPEIELPKEEDVDKAVDYLEGMIRKFRERFENFGEKTRPGSGPSAGSDSGPSSGQSTPDPAPRPTPDQKQGQTPPTPGPNPAPHTDAPANPDDTPL